MAISPSDWKAALAKDALHISGVATYPNDFSVASLERITDSSAPPEFVVYRVIFHRDKEPFCGPDLIGPVHYFERRLPVGALRIRVFVGTEHVDFPIRPA